MAGIMKNGKFYGGTVTDDHIKSVVSEDLGKKVDKTSIVTSVSRESTDNEIASAKLLYNSLEYKEITDKCIFRTDSIGSNGKTPKVFKNCNSIVIDWNNSTIDAVSSDSNYGHIKIPVDVQNYNYIVTEGITQISNTGQTKAIARCFAVKNDDGYIYVSITGQVYTGDIELGVDTIRGITEFKYFKK